MAPRKPIVHVFPEKTSFFNGLMSPGIGGYNWQFDTKLGYACRRPGTTSLSAAIDEFTAYPQRYTFTGQSIVSRLGIRGLLSYDRFSTQFSHGEANNLEYLRTSGSNTYNDAIRTPKETLAHGFFPWLITTLRMAHVVSSCTIKIYDKNGAKTVSIAPLSGSSPAVEVSTDNPGSALIAASSGMLNSISGAWGGESASMLSLPYGQYNYAPDDAIEISVPIKLPTTQFMYNNAALYMSCSTTETIDRDTSPPTAAQIGNFMYVAGAGSPLMRYDGSRLHAAGASPLVKGAPATLSVGGTGITGTFQYRILHRVYAPDGTYTDGLAYNLGSKVAANQTVTVSISRSNTAANLLAAISSVTAPIPNTTYAYFPRPAYKFTDFALSSLEAPTGGIAFTVTGSNLPAEFWPGDPIFTWNGSILAKDIVTARYPDGSIEYGGSPTATDVVSAGDVYVILRTVDGGSIYYELIEIPTGTASFADITSDATLLTKTRYLDTAYLRSEPPHSTVAVCSHQGRIIVAHRDYDITDNLASQHAVTTQPATQISWSEPGTEHFPPENSVDVGDLCGSVVGLASYNDTLYILTSTGALYVQGKLVDPTTFTVGKIPSSHACASPAGVLVTNNGVMYVTSSGQLVTLSGMQTVVENSLLPKTGYKLDQCVAVLDSANQRAYFFIPDDITDIRGTFNIVGAAIPRARNINMPYGTSGACLVVDLISGARFFYTGLGASGGATVHADGRVVFADRSISGISRITALDHGSPGDFTEDIPVQIKAAFEDAGSPHLHKTFTRLTTLAPDATSEFSLDVKIERDWDERRYIGEFTQDFRTGEGYADEPYATDPYGDGNIPDRVQALNNYKAKSLRVTFEHENAAENPIISGYVLEYSDTTREGREE